MNLLDGVLVDDAVLAFCDSDCFAESVTYTTRLGVATTLAAVIDRNPPELNDANGKVWRPRMTALIPNHATEGIAAPDPGGDNVTVAYRKGGTAEAFMIGVPIRHDAGSWLLPLL